MAKHKRTQKTKMLLKRVRRRRLRTITVLPSLVTVMNGVCGFAAITFAGKAAVGGQASGALGPYFTIAGYLLLLAMVADMLDGRLARMSQSTSSFGGQLDSLCDMISFGVAPAYLMIKVMDYYAGDGMMPFETFFDRFVWLSAAAYVSCAAIRLARFNVENEEDEAAHMSFLGLPTPASAGVIVSLVIFYQALGELFSPTSGVTAVAGYVIIYSLPLITIGMGVLMVSRIRYPHVVNQYIKGKKPLTHLLWLLAAIGLLVWSFKIALVVVFSGFAAIGLGRWLYYKVFRLHQRPTVPALAEGQTPAGNLGLETAQSPSAEAQERF